MRPDKWFFRWLEKWIDMKIRQVLQQRHLIAQEWHRYQFVCVRCHAQVGSNFPSPGVCPYCGCRNSLPVTSGEHPAMKRISMTGMMNVCQAQGTRPIKMYLMLKKVNRHPTQVLKPLDEEPS